MKQPIELDLFFQIYRSEIELLHGEQHINIVLDSYLNDYLVSEFFNRYIYLPF